MGMTGTMTGMRVGHNEEGANNDNDNVGMRE